MSRRGKGGGGGKEPGGGKHRDFLKIELPIRKSSRKTGSSSTSDLSNFFRNSDQLIRRIDPTTANQHGTAGVPGKRGLERVSAYTALPFTGTKADTVNPLVGVLDASTTFRGIHDKEVRDIWADVNVPAVNRKADYGQSELGVHSFHIGRDIAAIWTSRIKGKERTYDYETLSRKLDRRLGGDKAGAKYFADNGLDADQRRQRVAQGIKHYSKGDAVAGNAAFDEAGLTAKGRKWAYKMTSLTLAERAREQHHGSTRNLIDTAFDTVGTDDGSGTGHTFQSVFTNRAHAPFAVDGGASAFREIEEV
ncbi:hypothetical protein [Chitinimonas koreensis]|uniref:hypothetical protein n=1 Tax=Chitinimonas koreensis TaxID=356302 RepID=UPI000402FE4F|nr:hypothetical protein [Chitinimonas koreensis]QNM95327.1 hypothetical protein H9L41_15815 [Chitinimonas koreensis]